MIKTNDKQFEHLVEEELKQFTPQMRSFGFASTKKQNVVNFIIFSLVIASFTVAVFFKGYTKTVALELGLLLLSVKLAYFMHNIIKFNHYMFWSLHALELHLLNIEKGLHDIQDNLADSKEK